MLGDKIRKIRTDKNIGLNEVARQVGIAPAYLSLIETNQRKNVGTETLQKIANILDVSVNEFFDDEDTTAEDKQIEKSIEKDLPVVPEEFTVPGEARAYVEKHQIFGSDGFDPDSLDDKEILEFANALLEQMKMVSYKYRK